MRDGVDFNDKCPMIVFHVDLAKYSLENHLYEQAIHHFWPALKLGKEFMIYSFFVLCVHS